VGRDPGRRQRPRAPGKGLRRRHHLRAPAERPRGTFANGAVVRELIVDVDHGRRRIAYTAVDGPLGSTHHNASFEALAEPGGGTLLVWVTDLLPDEVAPAVEGMMDQGVAAIHHTLDGVGVG
jgi:hypothetical protein